jgi:kinetochore protein Nuf2
MSHMVATERATLTSHQRKGREHGQRLEVISGLEVDLKGLIDLEKNIDVQRIRVEEARRNVVMLRTRVDNQTIECQSMASRVEVGHFSDTPRRSGADS